MEIEKYGKTQKDGMVSLGSFNIYLTTVLEGKDGNKDTDLLENGLEDMGRGWGEM